MDLGDWYERLEELSKLEENWDNCGASPPTPDSLDAARDILELIADYGYYEKFDEFSIAPLHKGIEFEIEVWWETVDRKGAMIDLGQELPDGEADYVYVYEEGGPGTDKYGFCWDREIYWEYMNLLTVKKTFDWLFNKEHECLKIKEDSDES